MLLNAPESDLSLPFLVTANEETLFVMFDWDSLLSTFLLIENNDSVLFLFVWWIEIDGIELGGSKGHLLKAPNPIDLKDVGFSNTISYNDLHPKNDFVPIDVTEDGIVILFNDVQFLNDSFPIDVIDDVIVISSNVEHLSNNLTWIFSIFPVIIRDLISSKISYPNDSTEEKGYYDIIKLFLSEKNVFINEESKKSYSNES